MEGKGNKMENRYIVSYSRLQEKFILLKASNKIIINLSSDFTGIYKFIKKLQSSGEIHLTFTDSCIDELQNRNLCVEGVC